MFDLGWSKLIIIAIVAIVVVGPKDLPPLLRAIGKFLGQMRKQAEEFRAQFNDAMKDTGLDEVRRDIEGIRNTATSTVQDIGRTMEESTRPLHDAAADIERAADMHGVGNPAINGGAPAMAASSPNGSHDTIVAAAGPAETDSVPAALLPPPVVGSVVGSSPAASAAAAAAAAASVKV